MRVLAKSGSHTLGNRLLAFTRNAAPRLAMRSVMIVPNASPIIRIRTVEARRLLRRRCTVFMWSAPLWPG